MFDRQESNGQEMTVPCGQCIGCRLDKSLDWATRMVHESKLHDENCFATFTYDEDNLPTDGSLVPHHFQDFMKRLRKRLQPQKVRYFHCGEYGDDYHRPHYHGALFGFRPDDLELFGYSNMEPIYTSAFLDSVWTHGKVVLGELTFESAAYIARYTTKKVNGDQKDAGHYIRSCPITGETTEVLPEYATMSRRPGIGGDHYERYSADIFPSDEVVINGHVRRPPRYYANLYRDANQEGFACVRQRRKEFYASHRDDCTYERLVAREKVKEAQFAQLRRGYEK